MEAIASLLHNDPYLNLTPRQRAQQRRQRRQRIAALAKPDTDATPVMCLSVSKRYLPPEPPKPKMTNEEWIKRQEKLNPISKYWFHIEDEIDPPPYKPNIKDIQRACAQFYGITGNDILSDRRVASVVKPRHIAIYLTKKLTLHSLPDIGRRFGNRDHTSILFAIRKITALRAINAELATEITAIEQSLNRVSELKGSAEPA